MGQNYRSVAPAPLVVVGAHGSDTTISASTTLTPPAGASRLLLQAQLQTLRYTLDGTTPTASVGFTLLAGDTIDLRVMPGMVVKVIEAVAGGAIAYQWGA